MTISDDRLRALLRDAAAEAATAGDDPVEAIDALIAEASARALETLGRRIADDMAALRADAAAYAHGVLRRADPETIGPYGAAIDTRRAMVARRMARLAEIAAQVHANPSEG